MQTFNFQGATIAYQREGRGAPIVFLHNGGTSHAIWREVTAMLAHRYEVFAIDLLGYGASDKPGAGYTLANYVALLDAFVKAHGLAPVTLVGNCMGSAISLAFAQQHPASVSALVLINPLTLATFSGGLLGVTYRLADRYPTLVPWLADTLGSFRLPRWSGSTVLRLQLGRHGWAQRAYRNVALRDANASAGQIRSVLAILDDMKNYAALDHISPGQGFPPICTIWGKQNKVLSPRAGATLNHRLKPQRQELLEGCGHLLMLEQPETVAAIIDQFQCEHVARAEPMPLRA